MKPLILALLTLLGGLACGGGSGSTPVSPSPTPAPTSTPGTGWSLVWSDEFEGSGLPDATKWSYEKGLVRNSEAQYYTEARPENARQEGGNLVIEARKEAWQGASYTSASLTTRNRKTFLYGRLEVRAKIPTGKGVWPAFWTLGDNIGTVGWPTCGEIDIMEYVGFDPNTQHCGAHTLGYYWVLNNARGTSYPATDPWADFHLYALEWFPDRLDFYFDQQKVYTLKNDGTGVASWPFDQPLYLILNLAIGGSWGGQQGIDDSLFPQRFLIDYVRVYEWK